MVIWEMSGTLFNPGFTIYGGGQNFLNYDFL